MARSSVVLPQPDGPTSAVTRLRARSKVTSRTTWWAPKATPTPARVTALPVSGSGAGGFGCAAGPAGAALSAGHAAGRWSGPEAVAVSGLGVRSAWGSFVTVSLIAHS